jgi:hypothetical protein
MFQEKVEAIVLNSAAAMSDSEGMGALWDGVKERMFSLSDGEKHLGLGDKVRALVLFSFVRVPFV